MTLRPGEMRHRVTVYQRSTTQSASGAQSTSWTPFATSRFAAVRPLTGSEFFSAHQMGAVVPTEFRVRYLSGMLPQMRIAWDGRLFDVVSVAMPNGIREEMVVLANELVGEAVPS
jgi:SPP1 family predicted phage head-tail adaptor